MHILFYYLYGGGGAAQNMKVLYRALADQPSVSRLTVVCSRTSPLCDLATHPKVTLITVDWFPVRELNRLVMGFGGLSVLVGKVRPDVVLAMNLSSYVPLGAPSILSINNPFQVYPRAIDLHHPKGRMGATVLRLFSKLSLDRADGAIFQTRLMRDYALKIAGRSISAWVIGKSVENENDVVFQPLPDDVQGSVDANEGSVFSYLYAATPIPHKNHRILFQALERLRSAGASVRVLLTLSREDVEAMAGALGTSLMASGHVVPLGFLKKAQIRAAYDAADACVMPSILESLSSAHLEAMAWNKPQIVADLPYARDLCGAGALYCPPDDATAWAEAMLGLSRDQDAREILIAAGHVAMADMPRSVSDAVARLEEALRDVVRRVGV